MKECINQASLGFEKDEIPIGSLIEINGKIISKNHNMVEKFQDCTAHAEILCISSACNFFNSKYLKNCTIYTTLEPCLMCIGAIISSKIRKIVFGSYDLRNEFISNDKENIFKKNKILVVKGILQSECDFLLKSFFEKKRN